MPNPGIPPFPPPGPNEPESTKIAVAEAAVSHRARELTTIAWDIDEHLALRDAAFSLHLFKSQSIKG
jgi:hypothetical protein